MFPRNFVVEGLPTGQFRARRGWFGKLVLQVEVYTDTCNGLHREYQTGRLWRDATEDDVGMRFGKLSAPMPLKTL